MYQNTGLDLSLAKATDGSTAIGASISRFIQYAKITVQMAAIAEPGAVTAMITMSPRKDEIDWEFVGQDITTSQSKFQSLESVVLLILLEISDKEELTLSIGNLIRSHGGLMERL